MQRRAAAIYAAFFILISAGAYAMIGVAQEPTVSIEDPAYSLGAGQQVDIDGRTYTVSTIGEGGAELTWTNESAPYTATLEANATVPPTDVQWQGQTARHSATLSNGSTVAFNGSQYRLTVAAGENPTSFGLSHTRSNQTEEFSVGDTLAYRGNETTVTAVTPGEVVLVWGDAYRVEIPNTADPSSFTFRQEFDVGAMLAADPAVENETITRADGRTYVVYEANGSTVLLDAYLPAPETQSFAEGDRFVYQRNDVGVATVTNTSVTLEWTAPRENTVSVASGDNVTLNGREFVGHLPNQNTLVLSTDRDGYQHQLDVIDTYNERINGLWSVTMISGLTAVVVLALAYLPSRY